MARKRTARKAAQRRGQKFETRVGKLLERLAKKYPEVVEVRTQPVHNGGSRQHRPDFELKYKLGGLQHRHLIECQDRDSYSYDLADKIYAIRGTTEHNRYIFVYRDSAFVKTSQEKRLKDMGVVIFNLNNFESFIRQLEADIALRELGLRALREHSPQSGATAASEEDLRDSARQNNLFHNYHSDGAMLSTR